MINSYWGGPGGRGAGGQRPCGTLALEHVHVAAWQRRRAPQFPAVLRSMPRPAAPANDCRCRSTIMCFYGWELTA
eukprot:258603-Chlamydomonas_euryale.AAC.1